MILITGQDRRQSSRKRTVLSGVVVFNHKQSTMNCRISDLGEHGARLRFDGPPIIPRHFELRFDQRDEKRAAHRVWTTTTEVGIAFD